MRIILTQNVPKVGKKWEVREVSAGFARNHLFPKNLAQAATPAAIAELERRNKKADSDAEQELHMTEELASKLDGLELEIPVKVNEKGDLYNSISVQTIMDSLGALGFKINKKDVSIEEEINGVGEYPVSISLKHGLEAEVKVVVIDEGESEEETKKDS